MRMLHTKSGMCDRVLCIVLNRTVQIRGSRFSRRMMIIVDVDANTSANNDDMVFFINLLALSGSSSCLSIKLLSFSFPQHTLFFASNWTNLQFTNCLLFRCAMSVLMGEVILFLSSVFIYRHLFLFLSPFAHMHKFFLTYFVMALNEKRQDSLDLIDTLQKLKNANYSCAEENTHTHSCDWL